MTVPVRPNVYPFNLSCTYPHVCMHIYRCIAYLGLLCGFWKAISQLWFDTFVKGLRQPGPNHHTEMLMSGLLGIQ